MTKTYLQHTVVVMVVLTLALFTTKTLYIIPMLLLALAGGIQLVTGKLEIRAARYRKLSILFLLLWLPLALSSIDAVDSGRAIEKTLLYICFLPAGLMIIHGLESGQARQTVLLSVFVILCVWIIDGCIQFFAGYNLLGYPYTPPQLMGMFYPKVRMPYFLALLAPLFLEFIRLQYDRRKWLVLLLIPFGMMILLGGKRSAWIMLAFSCSGYLLYLYLLYRGMNLKKTLVMIVVIVMPLLLLSLTHEPLKDRIASTLSIFSTDSSSIDQASAHRLDLWKVAAAAAGDNWLNGVGPRSFRRVFNEYAEGDNFWIRSGRPDGTTHPHLQILEIACETGAIGLACYLILYVLLLRLLLFEIKSGRLSSMPWLLCPLTAFFPLNAHLAFYGTYWSCVSWWCLPLTLGVIYSRQHGEDTDH